MRASITACIRLALLCVVALISQASLAAKRTYCYVVPTVAQGASTYFEEQQIRCDVVWIDREIVINDVIASNGGDVILLAERIVLNAPIDTRPYTQTSKVFFDSNYKYPPANNWADVGGLGNIISAYSQLYYWREYWNSGERLWKFSVSQPHDIDYITGRISNVYRAAQLPSAQTPKFGLGWAGVNGSNAPAPGAEARTSGSVLIVANELLACEACSAPYEDKQLPSVEADYHDIERRRLIVVAGVKGGLGSPGTSQACAGLNAQCGQEDFPNVSGLPSKGGDAGNITIISYGKPATLDADFWRRTSDLSPGYPPFAGRLHTAKHATVANYLGRNSTAFPRLPPEAPVELGQTGTLRIESERSVEEVVAAVQSRLATLNLHRKYDPNLLVLSIRQAIGLDEEVVLPTDVLTRYFIDIRRAIYSDLLRRERDRLLGVPAQNRPQPFASFVRGLNCSNDAKLLISRGLLRDLSSLCALQLLYGVQDAPERAYFDVSGGLVSIDPNDFALQNFDSLAVRQRLQKLQQTIAAISFDTQQITALLDDANVREDTKLLRGRADSISQRITQLKQQQAAANEKAGAVIGQAIGSFVAVAAPEAVAVITLLNAADSENDRSKAAVMYKKADDMTTDMFLDIGKTFLPVLKQWREDAQAGDGGMSAELEAARTELALLMQQVSDLQASAADRKAQRMQTLGSTAINLLDERRALIDDYRAAIDGFEQLVKYAVVRAMAETTNASQFLDDRISDIDSYLLGYGKSSLPPTFTGSLPTCSFAERRTVSISQPGDVGLYDCMVIKNQTKSQYSVVVKHPTFGLFAIIRLDGGTQKEVSLKGLNVIRSDDGNPQGIVQ